MVQTKCQYTVGSVEMRKAAYTTIGRWLNNNLNYQMTQRSVLVVDGDLLDLPADMFMWRLGIEDGREHTIEAFHGWNMVPVDYLVKWGVRKEPL